MPSDISYEAALTEDETVMILANYSRVRNFLHKQNLTVVISERKVKSNPSAKANAKAKAMDNTKAEKAKAKATDR